ncbi:sulfotransferase family 2 domain-containing protein [Candidatus Methylobacter oryzae]|uniref:Sulfotransferase family protein n=1 Tax=Candidatus Methylobacter oryzae TaxID=2497749 RepID=A0ABY3CG74_9GAMM|nr:sulfotransferase family 2 domain-containing protein [Candidatus Methylobacter oryzae]TRX02896.1 sulfotransferase family protein [Candidatus Methylobacter oryzae]
MLILQNSVFLHYPKTGGTWVRNAIAASGINCDNFAIDENIHLGLKECPYQDKFKFTFVRHPVNLYRSYWQYKMTHGWDEKNPLDINCQSGCFQEFVRRVLDQYPGCYSKSFLDFIGHPDHEIEFIGRNENLVEDLITALRNAGETFDENAIKTFPRQNVSNQSKFPANYSSQLESEVREAESIIINMFKYD